MIQKRSVAAAIVLSIITCGLYSIYWMIVLNDDTNRLCNKTGDMSGGMVFLLTLITCGIYGYIWCYLIGEKLDRYAEITGEPRQSRGLIYLVLSLFGFGIVSYALMQDSLNKLS